MQAIPFQQVLLFWEQVFLSDVLGLEDSGHSILKALEQFEDIISI